MSDPCISVRHLQKAYGDHVVLKDVSFDVAPGTIFALLGENGAGKTTIVHILSTLLKPDSGMVSVGGCDISNDSGSIRRMISVTGQYAAVDEQLTGEENLLLMGRLYRLTARQAKERTEELLRQFELMDARNRLVHTYSGGMRRRLDIAVSLLASPSILFLDEPTTGLDPRSRIGMWAFIRKLTNEGMTVLLTTQYLEEADQLADTIAVMNDGRIAAIGTPAELKGLLAKERIHFVYGTAEEASAAAAVLADADPVAEDTTVSVPVRDAVAGMRDMLNMLHAYGSMPEEVRFSKPTLDDVFLQLTAKGERVP